jgi:hypothetical protein
MSEKRRRGGRAGRRVQRGRVSAEAREEQEFLAEYKRLHREAHELYASALFEGSGLRCYPEDRAWGFMVPLPNEWYLELTDGGDGALLPPWHEEGTEFIFWLITPEGLYAVEEERIFRGRPEWIPGMVIAHACRLLWRHREEIVGEIPKAQRKGLPRVEAQKIKALVERGVFNQPPIEEASGDGAVV